MSAAVLAVSKSVEWNADATPASVKVATFWIWVLGTCLLYTAVLAHTPITVLVSAAHDDGYYLKFGRLLAEGRWLGPYDHYTLMKGPGFPLFLAAANWLGLSVSVARALFHCIAVVFFVAVCLRFMRSYFAAAALITLLVWEPVNYTGSLLRVLRDGFYADLVLVFLGASVCTLFATANVTQRTLYAAFSGAMLGWFWLTREEGLWAVPGFLLLALVALAIAVGQNKWREVLLSIVVIGATWGTVEIGYRAINLLVYKRFAGVETGERNYKRALSALHSVKSGGTQPFVSVTKEARKHIYAVSPTFATLAPDIEGDIGRAWDSYSCAPMPTTCGQIGSGWFAFMLRDAAAARGNHSSPAQASQFYGRLADEVEAACEKATLDCERHLVAELPNTNWRQLMQVPANVGRAITYIFRPRQSLDASPSTGAEPDWVTTLRFLNYPPHTQSVNIPSRFVMNGWYRKSAADWFALAIKNPSPGENVELIRFASPDLVAHFGDPNAANQRFTATITCFKDCILRFSAGDEVEIERSISEALKLRGSTGLGGGVLYVDASGSIDRAGVALPIERIARAIRSAAQSAYELLGVAVFVFGAIAFVGTAALRWRRAIRNVCFAIAAVSWALAGSRILIISLLDATMMPILTPQYLTPANMLAPTAAILSCVAAIQCLWPRPAEASVG